MNKVERFDDIAIMPLTTEGFENLTVPQKKLAYHLAKAGLWGKLISLDQASKYNLPLFDGLISLYDKIDKETNLSKVIHNTLYVMFAHGGIYHTMSGERLTLPLTEKDLEEVKETHSDDYMKIVSILTNASIPQYRTVQKEGSDVVKSSGVNFYQDLTVDEVNDFRKSNYDIEKYGDEVPAFGFNERLVKKENGKIERQIISSVGLYGKYVKKIISSLEESLYYTENEQQHESISTLIEFYKTGDAELFDKHSVAWVKDQESQVYFINGLIESYDDPLGIGCTFESLVAFKNPIQTAKVKKIIDNIQWFENNLPVDKSFKKEKAQGLSASSITVVSMAGDTSPILPLGVNLPNSDWVRRKHGSKSVTLANVDFSRGSYEISLREALYLPEYQSCVERYAGMTGVLHTDLHEIAGHGSCQVLPGVNSDVLSTYYSTIEESRADLVALYYIGEEKIKEFGIVDSTVDVKEAALAKYLVYLTNGSVAQLRRVKLGNDLTQAHFRNRQLISNWLFDNADKEKVCLIQDNGKYVVKIHDINYVKEMFGVLLAEIQRIKSEGDFEAAKNIVLKYGTVVDQEIHKEIIERIEKLNLASVVGFLTPELVLTENDVIIEQPESFFDQQMKFYKDCLI